MDNNTQSPETEIVEIEFPSSHDYVPGIRAFLSSLAIIRGFSLKDACRIEAIIDELCNNAIEYGSKLIDSTVQIECIVTLDCFDLCIMDSGGNKEDIEALEESVILESKKKQCLLEAKRGRGLQIVKMLSDEVAVHLCEDGETEVHVIKRKETNISLDL